jgi:ribA/ribD-fused uncharacterized protein
MAVADLLARQTCPPIDVHVCRTRVQGVELHEPMYYLGAQQGELVRARRHLAAFASLVLPMWVPHAQVGIALGYGDDSIRAACQRFGPYVWATEFENVHVTFQFSEPGFAFGGHLFRGSEQLYQLLKVGGPESAAFGAHASQFATATAQGAFQLGQRVSVEPSEWDLRKDDAMRLALRLKFTADSGLRDLLLSTAPHPLVSVKEDAYWGAGLDAKGQNRLGTLLTELRTELSADVAARAHTHDIKDATKEDVHD